MSKKIEIYQVLYNGVLTDAKYCPRCQILKTFDDFSKSKHKSDGRTSHCKTCKREKYLENKEAVLAKCKEYREKNKDAKSQSDRKYRKENKEKLALAQKKWYLENKEELKKKNKEYYEKNKESKLKKAKIYAELHSEKIKEYQRLYRKQNTERLTRLNKEYYQKNKDRIVKKKHSYYLRNRDYFVRKTREWTLNNRHTLDFKLARTVIKQRRRAKESLLPSDITKSDVILIRDFFGNKCAITGNNEDTHLDHFIPIDWGHGGSVKGNLYPIDSSLNMSKRNKNPFEWIKEPHIKKQVQLELWQKLIIYLAEINNLTISEFERFVYWCESNKRSMTQIKNDGDQTSIQLFQQSILLFK